MPRLNCKRRLQPELEAEHKTDNGSWTCSSTQGQGKHPTSTTCWWEQCLIETRKTTESPSTMSFGSSSSVFDDDCSSGTGAGSSQQQEQDQKTDNGSIAQGHKTNQKTGRWNQRVINTTSSSAGSSSTISSVSLEDIESQVACGQSKKRRLDAIAKLQVWADSMREYQVAEKRRKERQVRMEEIERRNKQRQLRALTDLRALEYEFKFPGRRLPGRRLPNGKALPGVQAPKPPTTPLEKVKLWVKVADRLGPVSRLSTSDMEARLQAILLKVGSQCTSPQNPKIKTKCSCLRDFLLTQKKSKTQETTGEGVSPEVKLYREQITKLTVLYTKLVAILATECKGNSWTTANLTLETENTVVSLFAFLCNFHFGLTQRNTNSQLTFSFGIYRGEGPLPIRFCSNTLLQRILSLPESLRKGVFATLNHKSPYTEKLLNNSVRYHFLNLHNAGYFQKHIPALSCEEERKAPGDYFKMKVKESLTLVLLKLGVAPRKELGIAVSRVIDFYLPSRQVNVARCLKWGEYRPTEGLDGGLSGRPMPREESGTQYTTNGQLPIDHKIFVCFRARVSRQVLGVGRDLPPEDRNRAYFQRGISEFLDSEGEGRALKHTSSAYFVDISKHEAFLEELALKIVSDPLFSKSNAGHKVNHNPWMRFISTNGSTNGPVQFVHRLSQGAQHATNFLGPDMAASQEFIEKHRDDRPIWDLYDKANAFDIDVREAVEYLYTTDWPNLKKEAFRDKYDVKIDMGVIWTQVYFRHVLTPDTVQHNPRLSHAYNQLSPRQKAAKARKFQVLHTDFPAADLYSHQVSRDENGAPDGDRFMSAFFPLSKEGMTLAYFNPMYGLNTRLLEIPYGQMVIIPATLLHAGGFCTSLCGNPRGHMYIYLRNKKRKARKLPLSVPETGVYAAQNDYWRRGATLRKYPEEFSVYRECDPDHTWPRKEFDELFNL